MKKKKEAKGSGETKRNKLVLFSTDSVTKQKEKFLFVVGVKTF
jgi:hypothetical protein